MIKRCPYCRSVIKESDRYCDNCGTQLLFPEDENLEEPIPGDRIIEAEESPKKDLVLDSIKSKPEPEKRPERGPDREQDRKFLTRELPEMGRIEPPDEPAPKAARAETRRPGQEPAAPAAGDFDTGFPTTSLEMQEIARLLASLEKKDKPASEVVPPPAAESPYQERDLVSLRREGQEEEKPEPPATRDELPPWAERVKEGATPGFRASTQDIMSRDSGDFSFDLAPRPSTERPADTGEAMTAAPADDFYFRRGEAEEEVFPGLEDRPRRAKSGRGFAARLKARVYDILIITLVWVAAVWASSRLLRVSMMDLALSSALEIGIFYLILLVGYFVLFLSFLGETLGDRIGSSAR